MAKRKGNRLEQQQEQRRTLTVGDHVWAYLRHSPGDKQTIDSQRSAVREWCAQNGWVLDHEFIDEGVEGSKEQREHFQEMIALARQTPRSVAGIVMWSFSRFARDLNDAQYYKALLRKLGYVIVSKTDDIADGPMAPLMEVFIDMNNQHFLDTLSADITRGQHYIVSQGFVSGTHAPVGYRLEKSDMGIKRNGEMRYGYRFVKDEAIAERISLAWSMKLEQNASFQEIHKATSLLNHDTSYASFFNNLIYAGIFKFGGKIYPIDWEQGARFCEPYVTLEQFNEVQALRKQRTIGVIAPRLLSSNYLLTGLLYCSACGRRISGTRTHHEFYRCQSKSITVAPSCSLPNVSCSRIDGAIVQLLKQTVLTPEYVKFEVEKANTFLAFSDIDMHAMLGRAIADVNDCKQVVESLLDVIGKKTMTPTLEKKYDEAERALLEAELRLSFLKVQPQQSHVKHIELSEVYRYLDDVLLCLDKGSIDKRRRFIARFVERIVVHPTYLEVTMSFRLDDDKDTFDKGAYGVLPFRQVVVPSR